MEQFLAQYGPIGVFLGAVWAGAFAAAGYLFGETVHGVFGRHVGRWTLLIAGAILLAALIFALARRLGRHRRAKTSPMN